MSYKNTTCVVTGGGGFLGQTIVEELLSRGADVTVVENFSFGANPSSVPDGAEIVEGDIRHEDTFAALPSRGYDYVFHFAAPSSIVNFNGNATECTEITIRGFLNVAKWAIEEDVRVVYPSTGSLYSGTDYPHSEDSAIDPDALNEYAKAKFSLELIHGSMNGLDAVALRIFAGYGPAEVQKGDHASVVHLFARSILKGDSPLIFGDGTQKRDFVHARDVAKATLAIGREADEQVVNIGSGAPVSFNELVEVINEINGTDIEPEYSARPDDYLERTEADRTRMEQYYPKLEYGLRDGISEVVSALSDD